MTAKAQSISIPPINRQSFELTIIGTSPLITHRFSDESKKQMLDKQMKKAAKPRKAKDPEADYKSTIYRTADGQPGFPATGIKKACIDACSFIEATKVWARGAFYILGDILPIKGEPRMREDIVRLGGRTADIRYRAEFPDWSITFTVLHNPDIITIEGIANLIENAGFYIGIGDWRPQKNGTFGMFTVKRE